MRTIHYLFLFSLFLLFSSFKGEQILYVDANAPSVPKADGSSRYPFPTIDKLMSHIQKIKKNTPETSIVVYFKEGTYFFNKGYNVTNELSNVTFTNQNNEKVSFSGGISLPIEDIEQLQSGVSVISLKNQKIKNYGQIYHVGFGRPSLQSWMELFINGKPMHLSRWPNKGMIRMGKVLDTGSIPRNGDYANKGAVMTYDSLRISSWQTSNDMWMAGYFHHGYADDALRIANIDKEKKQITTDGATLYGFNSKNPWNKWYAFNIKEETDEKGEFFLDKKEDKLYFVSPDSVIRELVLSKLDVPFFTMDRTSNFTIENITFEYSRGLILALTNTEKVKINNCVFRNSGNWGVMMGMGIEPFSQYLHEGTGKPMKGLVGSLDQHLYANQTFFREGGKDNLISNCEFYNLGAGGISLGGGNRNTLEPGNNIVRHCKLHDNNRIERSYRPHIYMTGVGNIVQDCEIYHSPSMAILMHGNNHILENNYIHHVVLETDDQGAFYYGRNPSECGTIIRNNVFAHIPDTYSTCAIYHDDGAGGLTVENNIFYKAGRYGALLGGGSDNVYRNNTFIEMPIALHIDNRLENWSKALIQENGLFEKRLKEVGYNEGVYAQQYPYMKDYWPYKDAKPLRNLIQNNRFISIPKISDNPQYLILKDNQVFHSEPSTNDLSEKSKLK